MSLLEKRALQVAVTLATIVPIGAGFGGAYLGPHMVGAQLSDAGGADSHFRYLSGLLLGIGLAYLTTVPKIESQGKRFLLLTGIVGIGGLARLISLTVNGPPSRTTMFALAMELVVTPGLAIWQMRVSRQSAI